MTFIENKYSVLFVDDEEKALKYFSRLYAEDFVVITASSVAAAKEILKQQTESIGVLITDQRMPEEKGIDLLNHARQEHPQIVRMLTTAYSDLSDAIAAVNNGEILRYITKPWDIDSLRMELNNAMQFFLLRLERDQLLHEKLNVWQRLIELNRIRDLLILSSGFTHLRNSQAAISAFLLKLPFPRSSTLAHINRLDNWDLLKNEIGKMFEISEQLIGETFTSDPNTFTPESVSSVVKELGKTFSIITNIDVETNDSIVINKELMKKCLTSLTSFLQNLGGEKSNITLIITKISDDVHFKLCSEQADWRSVNLMTCPSDLLVSFLICYHHSGNIEVSTSLGVQIDLSLPNDPLTQTPLKPDNELLDDIFDRYTIWRE